MWDILWAEFRGALVNVVNDDVLVILVSWVSLEILACSWFGLFWYVLVGWVVLFWLFL